MNAARATLGTGKMILCNAPYGESKPTLDVSDIFICSTLFTNPESFNVPRGHARYTIHNSNGVVVEVLDYGAIIRAILVPDRQGNLDDVTTGFDSMAEYEENSPYFGAIIGRVANRICGGKFAVDGVEYQVAVNQLPNHLHGGLVGFDKKIWNCSTSNDCLIMSLVSEDTDEGYPGTLAVQVVYRLTDDNALSVEYTASVSGKTTIINLTNHAYFNLAGHTAENIYDHEIRIAANNYLPKTDDGVPTGEIAHVDGSPMDLRSGVHLGSRLNQVFGAPEVEGFDHNFCVVPSEELPVARVVHHLSGRVLEVYTDQPGIQLYTANHLQGLPGKSGAVYKKHSSLALETQNYPDAVNHNNFPNCLLRPSETYKHRCVYKFSILE